MLQEKYISLNAPCKFNHVAPNCPDTEAGIKKAEFSRYSERRQTDVAQ